MKTKLYSMLLVLMMALLPTVAQAQTKAEVRTAIRDAVTEMNKSCPMDVEDGVVMQSVKLTDKYFMINMKLVDGSNFADFDAEETELLKAYISYELTEDEDFNMLIVLCEYAGYTVRLNISDNFGHRITVDLPYE